MSVLRYERPIVLESVRSLIAAAQSARAVRPADDPDRRFYLGVERAALELLHPEVSHGHSPEWLARQEKDFQEGYLRMKALIAAAMTAESWPVALPLPFPAEN